MLHKTIMVVATILAVAALAAGCAPQSAEPVAPQSPAEQPTSEPQNSESTPDSEVEEAGEGESVDMTELESGEVPEAIFAAIVADLADQSELRASDMIVVKAESVVWPDGSLGCPEPDMMYTMATVNGYHVVLETADGTFDYRATENGNFRLCENPPFVPVSPIDTGPPIE